MFYRSTKVLACFAAVVVFLAAAVARIAIASDHADPMWLAEDEQEANITGLFFFPDGDRMIVIFNVRRALTGAPPYNLDPFEYNVHMDTHTKVSFDKAEDVARYGGTVETPETISPDITLKFHLKNDATIKNRSFTGLTSTDNIKEFYGVRDDPFIFTKFFRKNVISMVVSIPASAFPPAVKTWVLWGTTNRVSDGEQIDHVGRSNRTQLGRFEILNTVPPNEHVAVIKKAAIQRGKSPGFSAASCAAARQSQSAQWLPDPALRRYAGCDDLHVDEASWVPQWAPFAGRRGVTDLRTGRLPAPGECFHRSSRW
jgi:hypothetical protein